MTADQTPQRGIVYAASINDRFVEEAFLSAETVKQRYPTLPITLFTDRPQHVLCTMPCFDSVEPMAGVGGVRSPWAAGQLNRLRCLPRTPYDHTLHLDTDTQVLTEELPALFDLLDRMDVAMVETATDDSYSRVHFGKRMFNAGLILYRRNDKTRQWLETWAALSERNFQIAGLTPLPPVPALSHIAAEDIRRRLLFMDQISLVQMLSPDVNLTGLSVQTLDYSWNHRGSRLTENNRVPVKILHLPALKELTNADIQSLAFAWKQSGRTADAARLTDLIRSKYP